MAKEVRTRTTIETESISIIASRQVFQGGCERCGRGAERSEADKAHSWMEVLPKRLRREGPWSQARQGLVTSLKALLRFLEDRDKGKPTHS